MLLQRAQAHTEPSTDQLVETAFVPDFEREIGAWTLRARPRAGPVLAAIHVDDEHNLTRRSGRVVRPAVLAPQALDQPLRCVAVVDLHEVRRLAPRCDLDVRERGRADTATSCRITTSSGRCAPSRRARSGRGRSKRFRGKRRSVSRKLWLALPVAMLVSPQRFGLCGVEGSPLSGRPTLRRGRAPTAAISGVLPPPPRVPFQLHRPSIRCQQKNRQNCRTKVDRPAYPGAEFEGGCGMSLDIATVGRAFGCGTSPSRHHGLQRAQAVPRREIGGPNPVRVSRLP